MEMRLGCPSIRTKAEPLGWGARGRKVRTDVLDDIVQEAHHNALNQLVVMEKWVDKHLEEIRRVCDGRTEAWVQRQHKINFTMWIKKSGHTSLWRI